MTVRICNMTFSDWVSLPFRNGWTDTFIFHIDSQSCIPPFEFGPLLKRMAAHTFSKRSSASLWVQVDGPGEWYIHEVRRSLKGLRLPFAVTRAGLELNDLEFSRPPTLIVFTIQTAAGSSAEILYCFPGGIEMSASPGQDGKRGCEGNSLPGRAFR